MLTWYNVPGSSPGQLDTYGLMLRGIYRKLVDIDTEMKPLSFSAVYIGDIPVWPSVVDVEVTQLSNSHNMYLLYLSSK